MESLQDQTCQVLPYKGAYHSLVLGLVISHLDYANIIFLKLPDSTIAMLQWEQNITARLVLDKEQVESTTECLKILHWLPIRTRVKYIAIMLVHKSLQGQAQVTLGTCLLLIPFLTDVQDWTQDQTDWLCLSLDVRLLLIEV